MEPPRIAWLVFGYLSVFGFTLVVLPARMLFAERVAEHRATVMIGGRTMNNLIRRIPIGSYGTMGEVILLIAVAPFEA